MAIRSFRAQALDYPEEELATWNQLLTLRPPPYRGGLARFLPGVEIGDPQFDDLPVNQLACHGRPAGTVLPQLPEPNWADFERLARAQAIWISHLGQYFGALSISLLFGFSIARFAEVLSTNGYAKDGYTALARYTATGEAMSDWMRFDLRDPNSRARQSLSTVRAMHAFARRRSVHIFNSAKGEGIPLSQLDMAEVLIGFAGVTLLFFREGFNCHISDEEAEEMCYFWRFVGYHLGIHDAYNPCESLETLEAATVDFLAWTRQRLLHVRPSTNNLRHTAIAGFAMHTGTGVNFWNAAFDLMFTNRLIDTGEDLSQYRPAKAYYNGMDVVALALLRLLSFKPIERIVGNELIRQRDEKLIDPKRMKLRLRITEVISHVNDVVTWRMFSTVYTFGEILGQFLLWVLLSCRDALHMMLGLVASCSPFAVGSTLSPRASISRE